MEEKETAKKLAMLASHVDDMVEVLTDEMAKYGEDMNHDYEHFFTWYAEDMYKAHVECRYYLQLQAFLRNCPDKREVYAYLAKHSNAISDELIDGVLQLHSTSQAAKDSALSESDDNVAVSVAGKAPDGGANSAIFCPVNISTNSPHRQISSRFCSYESLSGSL